MDTPLVFHYFTRSNEIVVSLGMNMSEKKYPRDIRRMCSTNRRRRCGWDRQCQTSCVCCAQSEEYGPQYVRWVWRYKDCQDLVRITGEYINFTSYREIFQNNISTPSHTLMMLRLFSFKQRCNFCYEKGSCHRSGRSVRNSFLVVDVWPSCNQDAWKRVLFTLD